MPQTVIVGGGIIGLSVARKLLQQGYSVKVVDANHSAVASTAAAGLLSLHHMDSSVKPELLDLMLESRNQWQEFARQIQGESGIEVGYNSKGILWVWNSEDDYRALAHVFQGERKPLSSQQVAQLEPTLAPVLGGSITEEAAVNPVAVVKALRKIVVKLGGELVQDEITKAHFSQNGTVEFLEGKAQGLDSKSGGKPESKSGGNLGNNFASESEGKFRSNSGGKSGGKSGSKPTYNGERFIFTGGAWLGKLLDLPIRPVKGQMLGFDYSSTSEQPTDALDALKSHPELPLSRPVWHRGYYLVPHHHRQMVLFGATAEEKGFDNTNTAEPINQMLTEALELMPCLRDAPLVCWSGLRPASFDGLPLIGEYGENSLVAGGHHRDGILLAPVTAQIIGELVASKSQTTSSKYTANCFSPKRFAPSPSPHLSPHSSPNGKNPSKRVSSKIAGNKFPKSYSAKSYAAKGYSTKGSDGNNHPQRQTTAVG